MINFTQNEIITSTWFETNAPNWRLVKRHSQINSFYFLYEENDPNKGLIYFPENCECKFQFIKIEDIPEIIQKYLAELGIMVKYPDTLPLPVPRNNRQGSYTVVSGRLGL